MALWKETGKRNEITVAAPQKEFVQRKIKVTKYT